MGALAERLAFGVQLLALADERRSTDADPYVGANIERLIVDRELDELEAEIRLNPGPLAKYVTEPVLQKHRSERT